MSEDDGEAHCLRGGRSDEGGSDGVESQFMRGNGGGLFFRDMDHGVHHPWIRGHSTSPPLPAGST